MYVIYLIVILAASTVGSVSGVGGGVMIKPIFDAISPYDTYAIGILSCLAALAMAVTSVIRQAKAKANIQIKIAVSLAIGAVIGGMCGSYTVNYLGRFLNDAVIKIIQASVLGVLLTAVTVYMNIHSAADRKPIIRGIPLTVVTGALLGAIATFLGIGGGPVNIAALCLLFAMDIKSATVNSLVLIVFSQTSKLVQNMASGRLFSAALPWGLIAGICVVAVLGGLIGTKINRAVNGRKILRIYTTTMIVIIGISIYNIVTNCLKL